MKRLVISLLSIFSIVFASQAATFTVTSNGDNTGVGTGTLRQALADIANTNTGTGGHVIVFSTPMTITLNNSLDIYNDADFNGLTVNGFVDAVAGPDVIIRSNNLCGVRGFNISFSATNMKFYGLVFQNLEYGIYFNASASATVNGSQIKGCYFGTDISGVTIQNGICKSGIFFMGVSSATIGGPNTNLPNGSSSGSNNSERCIFGGTCMVGPTDNNRYGAIQLQSGSNNVSILNNYIGVNINGNSVLNIGNPSRKLAVNQNGITIDNTPSFNTIISNNVISGAYGSGISIFTGDGASNISSGHVITGNIIGLDATGTLGYNVTTPASSFGNQGAGIYIRNASNVTIGGNSAATRNVISANGGATHTWPDPSCFASWNDYNQIGVYLEWCVSSKVMGNYIGTNASGASSGIGTNNILGNRSGGIKIVGGSTGSNNNTIGGTNAGEGNVISGNGYLWGAFTTGSCGSLSGINTGHGIVLQYADCKNTSILGNYIGLTADGISALGNFTSGIDIQGAANTTIGGSTIGARNYISANQFGITIQEDFDPASHTAATNTIVAGNYVGLNKNGAAVGNGVAASFTEGAGIVIQKGANLSTIGLAVAGGGNVISGNRSGIIIRNAEGAGSNTGPARTTTVQNNIIGLDPTGATAIPNTSATAGYGYGIQIEVGTGSASTTIPFGNIIGGTGTNQANTISANQKSGIYIGSTAAVTASTANSIVGNNIGTNTAGTVDLGNTLQGIEIVNVSKTTITSNLISGNDQNGISLSGSSTNTIQNNIIGSNITKTAPIPNNANGIALAAGSASNIIGGVSVNQPNFIFNNGANGVVVDGAASINNSIHQNSFSCNALRGIVLSPATLGGNNNYAAPTIVGTPTKITWTGPTPTSYIEVYETDGCATCATGTSTRLQGKTLVGSGTTPYVFDVAAGFDKTKTYTAIAHEANATAAHNTSEFSICYTLCQDPSSITVSAGGPVTFCEGGSVTLTAVITGGAGTPTYQWKNGAANITNATNSTYVAKTSGSYSVVYNSDQACTPNQASAATTVTVNPKPLITSANTANVCSGTALNYTITSSVASTYSWTRAVVTGISNAAGSGTSNPITETLLNTTAAPVNVVYTITPTSTTGSCQGAAFTLTVTVNPKPAISSPATANVCSGSVFTYAITSNVASSYTWTRAVVSGISNSAGSGNTSPISETLTNTTNAAVNVVYSITPTSTTGSCAGNPFSLTVTVNPKPVISSSATGTVCSGSPYNYTITSATSSTYSWTRAVVAGITNAAGSGSTSSISETLNNSTNAAVDVIYLITATSTAGTCASDQFSLKVTVNPKPVVSSLNTASVCSNSALNYNITSSVASSYNWTRAVVGGISNPAATSSANPITETLINTTAAAIDVIYSITPTSTAGTCAGNAFSLTVTVNPKPVLTSNLTDAVCSNSPFTYTITSNTASSYSWSRDAVTGISNAAATGNSSPISETLVNTTNAPVVVTYSITPTSTGGSCLGDEAKVNVTVNPKPIVTSSASASTCSNAIFSYTITSNATSTYAWSRSAVAGVTPTSNTGTANPISETLVSTSSAPVDVIYLIKATSTASSCESDAFSLTVTINPKPTITSPSTASVCSGSPVNYAITSSSTASYTWSRAAVADITPATGSGNSSTIGEILINATGSPVDVVYDITASSAAGCGSDATTVTITVNPKPVISIAASGPTTFCSGGSVDLTATVNGFTGGTFGWVGGGISWGNTNPITVTSDGIYKVTYTAVGTSCISDFSNEIIVSITPDATQARVQIQDTLTICLDHILLVGNKPLVGVGKWSIISPIPYAPADLEPGTSADSVTAINLVDGIDYLFEYRITSTCGVTSDTTFINVGVDDFGLTASAPSDTLCVKTKRTMSAHVTGKGGSKNYSYVWAGSDGTAFTTRDSIIVVSPTHQTTDYVVYVEDLTQIGCKTNSVPLTLNAINGQQLYVPNLITPNGDNMNEVFFLEDRTTYPGVHMPLIKEGSHVIVVNRWGTKVFEADNYENNWNPKDLTDGIYYYQITTTCGDKEYKSWLQILGNKNQ